jgi:hypothetical protein
MPLIVPSAILVVSTCFVVFYFEAVCRVILERTFERPYFQVVAKAIRLEFPDYLRKASEEEGFSADYRQLRVALKCDFKQLDYLVEKAVDVSPRNLIEVKLLAAYFRLLFLSWAARHRLKLSEARVIRTLEEVLRYFGDLVGRQTEVLRLRGACGP